MTQNLEVINAHKARLAKLELRAARLGNDAPPEVTTEIEEIAAKLRALETVKTLEARGSVPEDIGAANRINIMLATVEQVATVKAEIKAEIKDVKDDLEKGNENQRIFQEIVASSINSFHNYVFYEFRTLRRAVIAIGLLTLLVIGGLILLARYAL